MHIVAPTVWAWRPGRAKKFSDVYDELFTLFKFENKYLITCGKSFEDYLRDRLLDSVNL